MRKRFDVKSLLVASIIFCLGPTIAPPQVGVHILPTDLPSTSYAYDAKASEWRSQAARQVAALMPASGFKKRGALTWAVR